MASSISTFSQSRPAVSGALLVAWGKKFICSRESTENCFVCILRALRSDRTDGVAAFGKRGGFHLDDTCQCISQRCGKFFRAATGERRRPSAAVLSPCRLNLTLAASVSLPPIRNGHSRSTMCSANPARKRQAIARHRVCIDRRPVSGVAARRGRTNPFPGGPAVWLLARNQTSSCSGNRAPKD